ncbi:hypothetical protein AX15_006379 [Amanita polypyramis BW_CC]|nr:hypothetical protein AX15_006379 [Amanita polypyramis BW_CC]
MSPLEDAWARAWPKLVATSKHILGDISPRIARVGQLDAELLDHELVQLLQEPLLKAFSLIRTSLKNKYEHELGLLTQLVLYKLSIWNTGASYGSKLQDLRYIVLATEGPTAPSGLPQRTLLLHGVLTVILPYIHSRIRMHALSRAWPDAPSSDSRRKAWMLVTTLESTHALLGLMNFIAFLWNGSYRTLADRLLGMRLVPSRRLAKRDVSYEFMNRQMVWHAFTEFLIFLLPLINTRGIRRRVHRMLTSAGETITSSFINITHMKNGPSHEPRGKATHATTRRGKFWSLPQDECAICTENAAFSLNMSEPTNVFSLTATSQGQLSTESNDNSDSEAPTHPLNIPYIASCGDIYCYHCISEQMIRAAEDGESKWECLRCGELVTNAERLSVDIEENGTSDYDFTE